MEQLANYQATGNLNGSINNSVTTITLTSTATFPSSYPYRIRIDDEIMKVTGTPGSNQFTVVRADGSTTAASHSSGATVQAVLTKEALDSIVSIQKAGSEISTRRVLNIIGPSIITDNSSASRCDIKISGTTYAAGASKPAQGVTGQLYIPSDGGMVQIDNGTTFVGIGFAELWTIPPVISNWTWVNQGSATAIDIPGGGIYLLAPASNGDNNKLLVRSTPATPYTVIARIQPNMAPISNCACGIVFRESGTGKFMRLDWSSASSGINYFTNATTYSATLKSINSPLIPGILWGRLVADGTNITFSFSCDGINWIQIYSEAKAAHFTTAPDQVGFFANSNNNVSVDCGINLLSWSGA